MVLGNRWLALVAAALALAFVALALGAPSPLAADGRAAAVGVPRQGDVVHYRYEGAGEGSFAFQWNGTAERLDAFGTPVEVDVVSGGDHPDGRRPMPFELTFAAGQVRPVSYAWAYGGDNGLRGLGGTYTWDASFRAYGDFPGVEPCLVRAAWQGARLDEFPQMTLPEACPGLRLSGNGTATPLRDEGDATVDGVRARVFSGEARDGHHAYSAKVWLVEGLAYPVRAVLAYASGGWSLEQTYALEGFEPGVAPLLAGVASPAPSHREGAQFEETPRWGIVEGDPSAYPFPPHEAIATILAAPDLASFHEYLARSPEARVVSYTLYEDHATRQAGTVRPWVWSFTFNDPAGEGWVVQARRLQALDAAGTPVALPRAAVIARDGGAVSLPPLEPGRIPPISFSAADALADWARHASPDAGEPNWLWGLLQPEIVEGFESTDPFLRVGRRDAAVEPRIEGGALVQDATQAAWRDYDPRTGGLSWEVGGQFGDGYAVKTGTLAAGGTWGAPPDGGSARDARSIAWPAAAGLAASALILWNPARAWRVVLPLFSRLTRGAVLEHPRRAALVRVVREAPGIHAAELGARVGCGNGALLYHLAVLEREGVVVAVPDGRARRFFLAGAVPRSEWARHALLRTPSFRRVYAAVQASPGISLKEAAERAGLSSPAAHHAVRKLEAAGLVHRERRGRVVGIYAAEADEDTTRAHSPLSLR